MLQAQVLTKYRTGKLINQFTLTSLSNSDYSQRTCQKIWGKEGWNLTSKAWAAFTAVTTALLFFKTSIVRIAWRPSCRAGDWNRAPPPHDSQQPRLLNGIWLACTPSTAGVSGSPSGEDLPLISAWGFPVKPYNYASHIQCRRQKNSTLLFFMFNKHGRTIKKVSRKCINEQVLRRQSASISNLSSPGMSFVKRQYLTEIEFQRGSFSPNRELQALIY